jgi:hypothetical protein
MTDPAALYSRLDDLQAQAEARAEQQWRLTACHNGRTCLGKQRFTWHEAAHIRSGLLERGWQNVEIVDALSTDELPY